MNANRYFLRPVIAAAVLAVLPAVSRAETKLPQQKPGTTTAPAQAKSQAGPQTPASTPAQGKPQSVAKPAQKAGASEQLASASPMPATNQAMLLGQYDNWGAYWAAPNGRKVCFAAARPNSAQTNRARNPAYLFITSRPQDKVKDEISAVTSSAFKSSSDASVAIGGKSYALVTSADGAWVKNTADEARLIEAMRKGGDLALKGTTDRGLQSTDVYSMKGLAQALDRISRECK
jgi:hypothetical protein